MDSQDGTENVAPTCGEINLSDGNKTLSSNCSLGEEQNNSVDTVAKVEDEELQSILEKRMQPIMELVDSERTYVQALKLVSEMYIPLLQEPLPNLEMPSALNVKWRILWGNWLQLYDWHRTFLERLERCLNDAEVDNIPKLLIDSNSRLCNIYSKYCENHRKAALIAELHREFFEEVRLRLGDKHDIVSHLMKPVQRIMRYQLPLDVVVKYTEKADLPSLAMWRRALNIMKEIPKDTQLILEAARIDGYPGVITALGKLRIRDDLLVASVMPSDMRVLRSNLSSQSASSPTNGVHSPTLNGHKFYDSSSSTHYADTTHDVLQSMSGAQEVDGVLKFQERRLFLFDQSLLITEEVKAKKNNPFAQSSYQFKNHITVNKMKFETHWKRGRSTSTSSGGSSTALKGNSTSSTTTTDDEEDIKFAIHELSRGKESIYVIDPLTMARRETWVTQLRELQNQQLELLLALQDPMRFSEKSTRFGDVFFPGSGSLDLDKESSKIHEGDDQESLLRLPNLNRRSHPVARESSKSSTSTNSDLHVSLVRRNSDFADNTSVASPLSPTGSALLASDEEADMAEASAANNSLRKKLQKSDSVITESDLIRCSSTQSNPFECRHPHHQQSLPCRPIKKKSRIFSSLFGRSSHKHKSTSPTSTNE